MEDKYLELYDKLSHLQWLLQRHHLRTHSERGPFADPTRGQGRVLAMLKMQSQISTKDLSYVLGIRQQSLNELLNKLEKAEYVTRIPSESDRRVMMVQLTEKGREEPQDKNDYSGIFDCLDENEQLVFGEYLDRVIMALEAKVGSEADEEEMAKWMQAARSRMGDDMFEQMKSMRGGGFRPGFGREFFAGFDRGPGHGPGHGPDHRPGRGPGHHPGHGPEHRPGHGPEHSPTT